MSGPLRIEHPGGAYSLPHVEFELDARLPEFGRKRYLDLCAQVQDRHAIVRSRSDDACQAREAEQKAAADYHVTVDPMTASRVGKDAVEKDHPSAIGNLQRWDQRKDFAQRAESRRDEAAARWEPLRRLSDRLDRYLADLGSTPVVEADAGTTKPPGGQLPVAIAKGRDQIAGARAEIHRIRSAPRPRAVTKAAALAEIEEMVARGRPNVTGLVDYGSKIEWPVRSIIGHLSAGAISAAGLADVTGSTSTPVPDTHALFAWLFRDRLIEAVNAEIDDFSHDDLALTDEQRQSKETELRGRLLDLERADVDLTEMSAGAVDFRDDTDPRAFLNLASTMPPGREF